LRDEGIARELAGVIRRQALRLERRGLTPIKIMNFCGTHEWVTVHYGLRSLMPPNVILVAGPGCPVCVTPSAYVELAVQLTLDGYTVYTYGDAYRLPSVRRVDGVSSLSEAGSAGCDVRVVYSFLDALEDARKSGGKSVFFAIGFETTAPAYAIPAYTNSIPPNLYLLPALRLTPPAARTAIRLTVERGLEPVSGIIAPGHVSAIIGAKPWNALAEETGIPAVISGFEPVDVLLSIAMLLKMLERGEARVEVEYRRLVSWDGNATAKKYIERVFRVVDSSWRGLGIIPESGLDLREEYSGVSILSVYDIPQSRERDLPPGCRCADVVMGLATPAECPLFMRACTPARPVGPCMVSSEGACAIWARFGEGSRLRIAAGRA